MVQRQAVNHDCVAMKYLLNSVAEWTSTLNGETSIDDLFKYYGQPLDEETLKSIKVMQVLICLSVHGKVLNLY